MLVQLLTAQCLIDSSITLLRCRLDSKNMKALKFICGDLKLILFKPKVLMDQAPRYYKKDWIQCLLEWVSISCTCIYLCWRYCQSEKASPIHQQVDICQTLLLLNLCDKSKMLSKTPQFHCGSIYSLTTAVKLLPAFWKLMNGETWPQYTFLWLLSACGARVQYTRQPLMQSNYTRYLNTLCCLFQPFC